MQAPPPAMFSHERTVKSYVCRPMKSKISAATPTLATLLRSLAAALLLTAIPSGAARAAQSTSPPAARVISNDHLDTLNPGTLELTRPVRTWEFLCAVGTRAGIFGNESGRVEAWVYPLKIFRDFHLRFRTEGKILDADSLARTVTVHPESTTILYTGDTFSVKETFFVPVNEPGAIIQFEIETESPLEIEAAFHRDFTLEWPAALGATYINWEADHHAFYFGEEAKKIFRLRRLAHRAGIPPGISNQLFERQREFLPPGRN